MPKGISDPRTLQCRTCGGDFTATNPAARYCGEDCNFTAHVGEPTADGCRLWTGAKDRDGYGVYWAERANRAAWVRAFGAIPEGLNVLHACDRPACVEPTHLMVGTNAANMLDRDRKGRQRNGAKLTADQVRLIRAEKTRGVGGPELAARYGVTRSAINRAAKGKSWPRL